MVSGAIVIIILSGHSIVLPVIFHADLTVTATHVTNMIINHDFAMPTANEQCPSG